MLYATPALEGADRRVLEELESMWEEQRKWGRRCAPRCRRVLSRRLTAAAIAGTNRIEGYRVAARDVEDHLDGQRDVDAPERTEAATQASHQLMSYVQALCDASDFAYSKGQLNALHWMLHGRHPSSQAGRWRREAVHVTDPADPHMSLYRPPGPDRLPTLMAELVSWLNEGDMDRPAVVRGAMAHLHLVKVHPWTAGNGRMSRFLQMLVVTRAERLAPEFHCVEEWLGRLGNVSDYYKVLSEVSGAAYAPERDAHTWLRFNLLACHQQAQAVRHRIDIAEQCWLQLTEFAAAQGIAECLTSALQEVALTGRLRSVRYQEAEDVSARQAQRDLQELVDAGLLAAVGRTRGRYFVPGDGYPPDVLQTVRGGTLSLTDPYQS